MDYLMKDEGYFKTAAETRRIMTEWPPVESTWPELSDVHET